MIARVLRPILCVKIRSGVWPVAWTKEKGICIYRKLNVLTILCIYLLNKKNDSSKNAISQEYPHEPISTRFGTTGCLADLITCGNFLTIGLGVFNLWGVEFCNFPIQAVTVNTVMALRRSLRLVRPYLEYCISAWSPCYKKDKILIEKYKEDVLH